MADYWVLVLYIGGALAFAAFVMGIIVVLHHLTKNRKWGWALTASVAVVTIVLGIPAIAIWIGAYE